MQRRNSLVRPELVILAAGIVIFSLILGVTMTVRNIFERSLPLVRVGQAIATELNISHLEAGELEASPGDAAAVPQSLAQAEALTRALRDNGTTEFGQVDTTNAPEVRARADELLTQIQTLRSKREALAQNPESAAARDAYNVAFQSAIATIERLNAAVESAGAELERQAFSYGILSAVLVVLIFAALFVLGMRNRRNQEQMNRDLEEKIRARTAELANERNLMRTLIDNVPDLVYVKDSDSKFVLANVAIARSMGVSSPADLLGKSDFDFHAPELAQEFRADEMRLMQDHNSLLDKMEQIRGPDGSVIWLSSTKVPLTDAQDNVIGLVGINRDVTQARMQALQLQEREAQYRRIVENAYEGIVSTDAADKIIFCNARAAEILGYASDELLGMTVAALAVSEGAAEQVHPFARRSQEARTEEDYPFQRKGGGDGWMHLIATPIRDEVNRYAGTLYMFTDISKRKRAEDAVRANETLYRSLVEVMPQGVFRKDGDGRITFGNARYWELLEVEPGALLGRTDYDFFPPELADKYRQDDVRVMERGITYESVQDLKTALGNTRVIRIIKTPLRDESGSVVGVQGMFWDITDARRSHDQIRKLSRAIEASSGSIVITDAAGKIEYVNPAFTRITGYTSEEVLGQNPRILKTGHTTPEEYEIMWKTIQTKRVWRGEFLNRRKNGEVFWESASISPILDEEGRITHFVAVNEDITERKQNEEKLRRQNVYLDALHDTTLGLMGRLDTKDLLQAITVRAATLVGTTHGYSYVSTPGQAEMEMNVGIGMFAPLIGTKAYRGIGLTGMVWESGKAMVIDDYQTWQNHIVKPGTETLHSAVAIPLEMGDRVVGVFGVGYTEFGRRFDETSVEILTRFAHLASIALDNARLYADAEREIAERKRANEQLRERQELLARVLDTVEDGIYIVDKNGGMTFANRATERIIGAPIEELVNSTYNDARWNITTLDGEPFPEEAQPFARVMATGESVYDVEQIIHRPDGRPVIVSINAAPQHDADGNIVGEVASMTDVTARKMAEQELLRQKEILQAAFDNIPVMIGVFDALGYYSSVNQEWVKTLGYTLEEMNHGDVLGELYPDTEQRLAMRKMMFTPAEGWRDFRTVVRDGRVLDTSWTVAHLSSGTTIVFGQDITKRKEVDRLKNEFISTVSHELRTPLTSIRGSLGLIAGGVAGQIPDRAKSMIDIAYKNSERLVRLINDILDIEKIESGKMVFHFKPLELMPLIEHVLDANRGFAEQYHVTFFVSTNAQNIKVNADADRLNQVLTNLISNAVKFSPPNNQVEVNVMRMREGVRVEVRDHGSGIPVEFQQRIFQKFAQADSSDTRQKGGTGLGLSIAKAIVEKHSGAIGFETTPGVGTTFYFTLPEWHDPLSLKPIAGAPKPRVLICEDDRDVALLLGMMLQQSGFETDVAYNANDARALLLQHQYAALTLDLMLPDKDGISLVRELRAAPETRMLPIVVVSAIADQGRRQLDGEAVWVTDWLQKPIDQQRLVNAVSMATQHSTHAKPQILHVEDDADVVQVVAAILHEMAEVTSALNLMRARELLAQQVYDLVILDPTLPDGSGLDLLPLLLDKHRRTPVVLFSANDNDPELLVQVNAALVKSRTSNQELLDTIAGLIRHPNVKG